MKHPDFLNLLSSRLKLYFYFTFSSTIHRLMALFSPCESDFPTWHLFRQLQLLDPRACVVGIPPPGLVQSVTFHKLDLHYDESPSNPCSSRRWICSIVIAFSRRVTCQNDVSLTPNRRTSRQVNVDTCRSRLYCSTSSLSPL